VGTRYTQRMVENLYSQRNIRSVLHDSIEEQLDKLLLNWAIRAFVKIPEYINGDYYDSKNTRMDILREQISNEGLDNLVVAIVAAVIHTHKPQTIQQCVGYLQGYLKHEDQFDRVKTAAELLAVCGSENGLFNIVRRGSGYSTMVMVNYWPIIDNVMLDKFDWINDTLFNPPLLERPKKVVDNKNCGYHTFNEPLILGSHTQHDKHQDYASINILNGIPWILDQAVLAEPEKSPAELNSPEKQRQFVEHIQQSQCVYNLLGTRPFFLTWQSDSRGRIYSHGYHVNFQSHEYKKAMLSFNQYEVLT
jgi:hypothetical protein